MRWFRTAVVLSWEGRGSQATMVGDQEQHPPKAVYASSKGKSLSQQVQPVKNNAGGNPWPTKYNVWVYCRLQMGWGCFRESTWSAQVCPTRKRERSVHMLRDHIGESMGCCESHAVKPQKRNCALDMGKHDFEVEQPEG